MSEIAIRQPWDKIPGESAKAFQAFSVYRDLGAARTVQKTSEALAKSKSTLDPWYTKYHWRERAEAWDVHRDRISQEEQIEEESRIRREQIQLGRLLRGTAAIKLVGRAAGMSAQGQPLEEVVPLDPNDLTAQDVARLATDGVRIERTAAGLPTDFSKMLGSFTLAELQFVVQAQADLALARLPEEEHEGYMLAVLEIGRRLRPSG